MVKEKTQQRNKCIVQILLYKAPKYPFVSVFFFGKFRYLFSSSLLFYTFRGLFIVFNQIQSLV